MSEHLAFRGKLVGHKNWVTSIATTVGPSNNILTSSRDKKIILWELSSNSSNNYENKSIGYPFKALMGHNETVSDVVVSSDDQFALSASWDKTLRLWDLNVGKSVRTFTGHTKDVLSVAFSSDDRQIVSSGRDKTIKLWNNIGHCIITIKENQHTDWVSCVKFSPSAKQPLIVSCGWDKLVKVWDVNKCKLRIDLEGHTGPLNTVTISPDGSLCASGGKEGVTMLWDVTDGHDLYCLESTSPINALCFSPTNYWLCAAADTGIILWDLETKNIIEHIEPPADYKSVQPWVVSVAWSADGNTLFAGSTDGCVYVYDVMRS